MMATRLILKVNNESNVKDYESINEREDDSEINSYGTGRSIPDEMIMLNSEEYGKNLSGNSVGD